MRGDPAAGGPLRLETSRSLTADVVHYYNSQTGECIWSVGNRFRAQLAGRNYAFSVPVEASKKLPMHSRLARRALRLDKSNLVINHGGDGLVILYQGAIWFYDLATERLQRVEPLRQSRNALHCGVAVTKDGIFFGEYGANPSRDPVPVWASRDDGRSWAVVWETPTPTKHIHAVYADPHSDRLWIPTGDFEGECYVYSVSRDFADVKRYGDGSQDWRPVSMFFEQDRIAWVMDTQLETPYLQIFDRQSGTLTRHGAFPGPCWYGKQLTDGWSFLQTTVEPGPGVSTNYAHLYGSRDLINWTEYGRYRKDRLPMRWFKSGVLAFADGPQNSADFVIFGEAVKGLDGRALFVGLV